MYIGLKDFHLSRKNVSLTNLLFFSLAFHLKVDTLGVAFSYCFSTCQLLPKFLQSQVHIFSNLQSPWVRVLCKVIQVCVSYPNQHLFFISQSLFFLIYLLTFLRFHFLVIQALQTKIVPFLQVQTLVAFWVMDLRYRQFIIYSQLLRHQTHQLLAWCWGHRHIPFPQ